MTQKSDQIRAVVLAALMVMSVFAGTIAFTGSAAADVDSGSINLGAGYGNSVSVENGSSAEITDVTINDSNTSPHTVWVDTDGNGVYNTGEPAVEEETPESGNDLVIGDLNVSSLSAGTYNVSAANATGTGISANDTIENGLEITSADSPQFLSAIHYNNGTADNPDAELELAFNEDLNESKSSASVTVLDSDENEVDSTIESIDNGRVLLTLDDGIYTDELTVKYTVEDPSGNSLEVTDNDNAKDVTFAATTVKDSDKNAYKGSNVALVSDNTSEDVEIEGEDNYAFSGSTGTNSKVFVFETSDRALGDYNATYDGTERTIDLRDLGLDLQVDDLNVTTDDTVDGTVSANAGNRPVSLQLYESDGDEFGAEDNSSLNGQGEYEFSIDEFSDSDDGEYTLEVRDDYTGVTVESATIVVEKGSDGTTDFGSSVVTEQRGDVAEIPITLSNTDTATVNIGSEDVGFLANVTVEDDNDDGEVVLRFNTWDAQGTDIASAFSTEDGDDDVTDVQIDSENSVDSLLDAGDYDLEVRQGTDAGESSDNVATLVLEERGTNNVTTWTASDGTDLSDLDAVNEALESDNLTRDSEIADGDYVVTQISASGLGGLYDQNENMFFDSEKVRFSVNQTEAGANRDPFWLDLNSTNVQSVVGDADNDTYYVVFDSDDDGIDAVREVDGDDVGFGADDGLTANFTVLEDEGNLSDDEETAETDFELVEGEHSLEDPYNVSNAAGQTIEGESNVAPGTELTIRVRSDSDVRPSFLKTASAYVTENNTFSADFDFSGQNVDDTFTVKVSGSDAASDETFDGAVVEGSATNETETVTDDGTATVTDEPTETTETATTEASETTEATATEETATDEPTETSTPGFGAVVALVALVAAALLAVRRD